MKFLAIIQARCGSTRLPNKILMPLYNKPSLLRTIERVKQSKYIDEVVVATSFEKPNLAVARLCAENDTRVFLGSENDVLDRFYQVAKLINPEYVVRITGDCPLFDSNELDKAIETLDESCDYLSNVLVETFPDGLDFEVVKFEALKEAWEKSQLQSEREHVTLYIRNNDKFVKKDFISQIGNYSHLRLTLDEKEDYILISNIYDYFKDSEFSYQMLVEFLCERPELLELNAMFARNEGLAKSLKNDKTIGV